MPGLPFTRDHPHLRSPAGVMSCDEIRHWVHTLLTEHGWNTLCLARTVGMQGKWASQSLKSKLRRSWIYPAEQVRMSRALDRIITGELVQEQLRPHKYRAVLADRPAPLEARMRMAFDLASGRLRYVKPRVGVAPLLPSFQTGFANCKWWEPHVSDP
jgi:hypothetical protein